MCLFEREPLAATSIISSRVFRCKFIAAREKYENWFGAREMRSLKPFLSRCRESCTRCANREREREREKEHKAMRTRESTNMCTYTRMIAPQPNSAQLSLGAIYARLFMFVPARECCCSAQDTKKKKKKKNTNSMLHWKVVWSCVMKL